MRRKSGTLIPLELSILETALELRGRGTAEAHGYLLARELRDRRNARRLTAYGTLYKALGRLEGAGFLTSRWEEPEIAVADGRPRRRLYRVTMSGEAALAEAADRRTAPGRSAAAVPS
jgi:PadR family transcriptional regulator PadR